MTTITSVRADIRGTAVVTTTGIYYTKLPAVISKAISLVGKEVTINTTNKYSNGVSYIKHMFAV